MVKAISLSTLLVLLVATSSFGAVDNLANINYLLGDIGGTISISGPSAVGSTIQTIALTGLNQFATGNTGQTTAGQGIGGLLSQIGTATTNGAATMTVDQVLHTETVAVPTAEDGRRR